MMKQIITNWLNLNLNKVFLSNNFIY
jgi:hypothetical protein